MNKHDALKLFGDPATDRAACVTALCAHLGISRAAFYQWPDDKPIPEKRQLQLEKLEVAKVVNAQLAAAHPPISTQQYS